ncbi:caspase domain-containing protein [Burkholderiaceae bacterium UC74_6]
MAKRRRVLQALASTALLPELAFAQAGVPRTDLITVLYRKESPSAPTRIDPSVAAATRALEAEFLKLGLRVLQPDARAYELLDKAPTMIVTFAPDAGFSLVFSLYGNVRPRPGSDMVMAEVRLEARVFVGRSILAAETGQGRMAATLTAATREFGERRSLEQAAEKAAAELAGRIAAKLKELTPERMQQLMQAPPPLIAGAKAVQLAAEPAPADPRAPMAPPRRKFALLAGVSNYAAVRRRLPDWNVGDLPGVDADLKNMGHALRGMGFAGEDITTLLDAQASSGGLRQELMKLAARTQEDDLVLIAISCHGGDKDLCPSGFGLPVLHDFSGPGDANALDFWQLQSLVANLPARRVVLVVDTCHSGGVAKMMPSCVVTANGVQASKGKASLEPAALAAAAQANAALATRHIAILAASKPEELSLEDPPNGGLFTSRLLRGLTAAKGQQPLEQVFVEQVERQVLETSRPLCKRIGECKEQTPMFAYSGRGNMIRI